jgi:NHLM bacteriocin system ABC transporter peptidase/ATP-binding protein
VNTSSSRPTRIKTPTILQTEALECGAACLAIVLGYFKSWVGLDELRTACGVSRDGSRAVHIWRAAEHYGLDVKSFRAEPHDLWNFHSPMILHWNFNHFVVLEGFEGTTVFLNDPASGRRTVDEKELDESFTGVVLVCRPGPEFEPRGRRPSFTRALARRLTGNWIAIVFVVLCGTVLMIPRLIAPFFSKIFVEDILLGNNHHWLMPLLLAMAGAALLLGSLTWLQQTYLSRLETWIRVRGSSQLFWHILRLPVDFFSQRFAGDVTSRLTLTSRVAEILSRDLAINFLNALMILFFAVLMMYYNPALTGACLAFVVLDVAALYFFSRKRVDGNRRLRMEQGKLHGAILGGLEMIETIKATGAEADLMSRWTGYQAKMINLEQGLERTSVWLQAVPPLLAALNTAIVLTIGTMQVLQGKLSLGQLVAFQLLLATFLAPVARLVGVGAKLQIAAGDLNRVDDILRYPAELDSRPAELPPPAETAKLAGFVELKNLSFGYNRLEPPLIQDFNLRLKPGERLALVGASGSGKSTVAKLVAGLLQPWSGEVCFDHRPQAEFSRSVRAGSVAFVDQTSILFEGNVRDNLSMWDPTVSTADIRAAADDARIHEDIAARPGGYDSLIEENARNWSGGQRQRLDIARALVGQPSILVLDEATSALDPLLEFQIDERLRRRGCTCLIVAHRLSTIRDADQILVLDKGKVVERGTHEELIAHGGLYHHLASLV